MIYMLLKWGRKKVLKQMVSASLEISSLFFSILKFQLWGKKEKIRIMADARNRFWNIRHDCQNS